MLTSLPSYSFGYDHANNLSTPLNSPWASYNHLNEDTSHLPGTAALYLITKDPLDVRAFHSQGADANDFDVASTLCEEVRIS